MKSPKPALVQLVQKSPQLRLESPGCPGLEWNSSAMILSSLPSPVFQEFIKMTNHDVEHAIKKRMSGDVRDAFVAIGQCSLRAGSPFSCHCQGSVAADSCCPWAMETPSGPWVGALTESLERVRPAPLYKGGLMAETVVPQLLAVLCPLSARNPLSVPSVCCSPQCEEQAGFLR